jgi:hypothetical protein
VSRTDHVLLRTTGDTNEEIWISQPQEIVQKVQHLLMGRWCFDGIRALTQSVQDNKDRKLSWQFKHVFETIFKSGIAGLARTIVTLSVEMIKNPSNGLIHHRAGRQGIPATDVTFRGVLVAKVIVCDQHRPGLLLVLDVLDNGTAYREYDIHITEIQATAYQSRHFPTPAANSRKGHSLSRHSGEVAESALYAYFPSRMIHRKNPTLVI